MSTAFHPDSDGQTERINQVIESYLQSYCNYEQDDWVSMLAMASMLIIILSIQQQRSHLFM